MSFEMEIPDDFLNNILKINSEELCREILEESVEPLTESMKKELEANKKTGETIKSIKPGPAHKNKAGDWVIQTYPHGYSTHYFYGGKNHNRKYKLSNAAKVIFLEYGTSRETARPFITKATNSAKSEVMRRMREVYQRKIGGM